MATNKRKKYIRFWDKAIYFIVRFLSFVYTRLFFGFRSKDKYKKQKDESLIVLSNHQTDIDPICMINSFVSHLSFVGTDTIFSGKIKGYIFKKIFKVIPKRKGTIDAGTIKGIFRVIKDNSTVVLFPEGNRTYAEFQYYISNSLPALIKKLGPTIVLYNIHGGTGISPRFASKKRKGKFYGVIVKVLKYDEYINMKDEELLSLIKSSLRVYDSANGFEYDNSHRAEYIERLFFACPVCNSTETIISDGNYFECTCCKTKVEYTKTLSFKSDDERFPYNKVIDYWNFQKRYIKNYNIQPSKTIFSDENIKLFIANPFQKKKLLSKGSVSLNDENLHFDCIDLSLNDISNASIISGKTLSFTHKGNDYIIKGGARFNPLKYIFMFNRLNTEMHRNKSDMYFNLEEN